MTVLEQDKKLLNDILERNYYSFFQKNEKFISLTFFYNLKYTNLKYIKDIEIPKTNISTIKTNFLIFLNWYIEKNFCCDIKIEDEFWLYDKEFSSFILDNFLDYIKESKIKCKKIIIKSKLFPVINNLDFYQQYINMFKQQNIELIFSLQSDLIDIANVETFFNNSLYDFILNNNFLLKIVINPNNFVYFSQVIFNLLDKLKNNIYLYEEANYGWTEHKIKEYFTFLGEYTKYYYNIYQENLLNQLIENKIDLFHLQDKGILDGTGSCVGNCSFYNSLCLLLEDFSINLCPKFQFDDQVIGKYKLEDDTLIAVPHILELISMNIHLKRHSTSHCENCLLLPFCEGCCCKSSYDACLNPIIPVRQFCEMQNLKYKFLFQMLLQNNLISKEKINNLNNISELYKNYLMGFLPQESRN